MNKKQTVTIVGGGLAGLGAAYELSKIKKFDVHLIEQNNYLGGRVRTVDVNGYAVDVGGFIIYNWYTEFHRLIQELNLQDQLHPIVKKPFLAQLEPGGVFIKDASKQFPLAQRLKITANLAVSMIHGGLDIAEPKLDAYEHKSVREYIQDMLGKDSQFEQFADTINQGYCYPDIADYKMAFLAPIIYNTRIHGDLKKSYTFNGDTKCFTNALAKAIQENGGTIHLNESVTKIQKGLVTTDKQTYKSGSIICAQTVDSKLYKQQIKEKVACTYTEFITAVIKLKKPATVTPSKEWGALFLAPQKEMKHQVLSYINLTHLIPGLPPEYIEVNIRILENETAAKTPQTCIKRIQAQIESMFPGNTIQQMPVLQHWKKLMPVAQEKFVQAVRNIQGKNNIYYAGDYLGSPSMETALLTGIRAANAIIDKHR